MTVEQVIELHDAFLEDHGGLQGIRDKGLLVSANIQEYRSSSWHELRLGEPSPWLYPQNS